MADDQLPTESAAIVLARMEVKLDHALAGYADHEGRIRILERKVWGAAGAAAMLAAGGSAAITKLLGG